MDFARGCPSFRLDPCFSLALRFGRYPLHQAVHTKVQDPAASGIRSDLAQLQVLVMEGVKRIQGSYVVLSFFNVFFFNICFNIVQIFHDTIPLPLKTR